MKDLLRVDIYKYTVIQKADGSVHALRNGEEWRDCTGDNLVLGLSQVIEDLQSEVEADEVNINNLMNQVHELGIENNLLVAKQRAMEGINFMGAKLRDDTIQQVNSLGESIWIR